MRRLIAGPPNPVHISAISPDANNGRLRYYPVELSAVASTVTTVEIPGWARIVKIYPLEHDVIYAIDENPVTAAFNNDTTLVYTDSKVGDVAVARQWESRILPDEPRFLHLASLIASAQLYVSFSSGA